MMGRFFRPRTIRLYSLTLLPALLLVLLPLAGGGISRGEPIPEGPEYPEIVQITVANRDELSALVVTGVDLTEAVEETDAGLVVEAIITPSEQAWLEEAGFRLGAPVLTEDDFVRIQQERLEMLEGIEAAEAEAMDSGDELRVQRVEWFRNYNGTFVNVEVWSSAGASSSTVLTVSLDAGPGTQIGDGDTFNLSRFVDAGQYMFHRTSTPRLVATTPTRMRVTSSMGGSVEADFVEFLDGQYPRVRGSVDADWNSLATGFVDRYVDATESTEKIEALAAEFPEISEIITLPHRSNGYRRKAQAVMGGATNSAVVVSSQAWGHEGGNDLTMEFRGAGGVNRPLSVDVDGDDITVSLATNLLGVTTSTAAQVVAALNEHADDLVTANTYRGNAGSGTAETVARTSLSDFLTAPDSVSREPFEIKAIRIGAQRNGSKVGVFLYSQEHAREWATPLVALETAERLLRNYDASDEVRRLVDNLDIFIVPVINPDGTHYSIHDFTLQRKSMTNYCGVGQNNDPNARNTWGVDLNRNFRVGNLSQGFSGASTSCTSGTYAGPSALSEPEAQNEIWLVETFPNIRFAMNTHSHGGYFMWAPGAYQTPGRVQLPRPSYGVESYFYWASDVILNRIKEHRGTVIWPGRVGPVSDVLYSAAGNSADDHFYSSDIFAWSFEVGAPRSNSSGGWSSPGFTPSWAEGFEQAMEFSHGWLGILEVANLYARDNVRPTSTLTPGAGTYTGPVDVTFDLSEPADVYYTLDGSRPTYDSPRIDFTGVRQGQAPITITDTTTVHWFSVDMAGNVEGGYNPSSKSRNYRSATIAIE